MRWTYLIFFGAGDGAQTRDLRLGKATLYQLSYSRRGNQSFSLTSGPLSICSLERGRET